MINQTLWYSTALASHLKKIKFPEAGATASEYGETKVFKRIDPRTRDDEYQKALSFEVFDPLWMLCRQWQYGRFKAVDCGTPVMVKVKTEKSYFDGIHYKNEKEQELGESYSSDKPLEYDVEKQNVEITPYVRVQSAMHLKKMLLASGLTKNDFAFLYEEKYKLLDEFAEVNKEKRDINSLKNENNTALKAFYGFYRNRSFDGYKVYQAIESDTGIDFLNLSKDKKKTVVSVLGSYADWFKNKFLPCDIDTDKKYWSEKKLGYELKITQGENTYIAEDYDTGKLSWYSFDYSGDEKAVEENPKDGDTATAPEVKMLSYIPTPAKIPGAPATRLWEFEDRKVNMGNCETDFSFIGTAAIMQYVSMFSNDWMIMPLETETGTVLDVKGIVVKDSFGDRYYIGNNAQQMDKQEFYKVNPNAKPEEYDQLIYTDRWNLYGSSFDGAYRDRNFSTSNGLMFPPTVLRCEESKPIEEVQFLRDEMANMVWGVETTINNRCGGTMDAKTMSDFVLSQVDELNLQNVASQSEPRNDEDYFIEDETEKNKKEIEYSLLIQNRVPINWIPFIPEQLKGDFRNIALRRARMPIFYDGEYQTVAPSTDLLGGKFPGYKRDENDHVKPMYINEEEVTGCGIKIIKTAQRTRWFLGQSFNWIGNKQVISEYQANSGLMFDELIDSKTGKRIKVGRTDNQEQTEKGEA